MVGGRLVVHCGWSWGVPAQEQLRSSAGAAQEHLRSSPGAAQEKARSSPAAFEKRWLVSRRGGWAVGGPLWVVVGGSSSGAAQEQRRSSSGAAQEESRSSLEAAQEQPGRS